MAHFDRTGSGGVCRFKARHNLVRRENLNLEFVVGGFRHELREGFGRAENCIERFWKTRRHPPFQVRHGLGNGRRCYCSNGPCRSDARIFEEFATMH